MLVVTWAFGRRGIPLRSRRFPVAVLITVVTALHNPYFACLYAQFLLFAVAAQAIRRARRAAVLAPLALTGILAATLPPRQRGLARLPVAKRARTPLPRAPTGTWSGTP